MSGVSPQLIYNNKIRVNNNYKNNLIINFQNKINQF